MREEVWNSHRLTRLKRYANQMQWAYSVCESWFEQGNNRILFSINLTFIEGIVLNTWHLSLHSHNNPVTGILLMFPYYPLEYGLSRITRAVGGGGGPDSSGVTFLYQPQVMFLYILYFGYFPLVSATVNSQSIPPESSSLTSCFPPPPSVLRRSQHASNTEQ